MKKLLFSLLLCMTATGGFAESFTIHGQIEGLMPGDTLRFERIVLPQWETQPAFDVVVEKPNEFTYSGTQEHTEYFLITYKPVDGREVAADRRGIPLLIEGGDTRLSGNTESIYYCDITGGLYDNALLQQHIQLDNTVSKQRGEFLKLQKEAYEAGDSVKVKEYMDQFNAFAYNHPLEFQRLDSLDGVFHAQYPSSVHTVVWVLERSDHTPSDTLQSRYGKMNEEARAGYYGKLLKREMDKLAYLTPGNTAPDFRLTTLDGREISLQDCAGKYLLLYHWGLCPGSIQLENSVTALYKQYKEHLLILGITPSRSDIQNAYDTTPAGSTIALLGSLDLKAVFASMLAHPWPDGEETTGDNVQIGRDYAFAGFPFFVFISPDGKMLGRGYHETFYEAKNRLETEFGK